jgi:LuxR family maltose regulon positive regulatory protein
MVLVSAPAGYGKTTLLASWCHARMTVRSESRVAAWYALDSSDNDSIPFSAYLVASLKQVLGPADGLGALGQLLRSSPDVDLQKVMSAIVNAVAACERDC